MTLDAAIPQLCFSATIGPEQPSLERIREVLLACPTATLFIKPANGTAALAATTIKPIMSFAQSRGVAVVITDDAELAKSLNADGVHFSPSKDLIAHVARARALLGPKAIVGGDASLSRHNAMELGDAGADYIGFGQPSVDGNANDISESRLELMQWWGEIFELPAVALDVTTAQDVAALAQIGSDFITIPIPEDVEPHALGPWALALRHALNLKHHVIR